MDIPTDAGDRRAAYQHGLQDDGLLLVFTLPSSDADAFTKRLAPGGSLTQRKKPLKQSTTPTTPFGHLGLPEPESLADVREGQVCNPCKGELNSLAVAVHPVGNGTSRIYFRGID